MMVKGIIFLLMHKFSHIKTMEWISVKEKVPSGFLDEDPEVLITDGENVSIGWHEHNFEEINFENGLYFPEEILWHDSAHALTTDCNGWPEVTHWAPLPLTPSKQNLTTPEPQIH
jgi:Protein of unknown function (DUF551)